MSTTLATRGLNIPAYDYVSNTYSGANLTQTVYRRNGASGPIVATLDYTYDLDDNVETITKS
jgi:hypothetical protein